MDLHVLVIVLLAAAAHAGWNAWLKDKSADLFGFATIAVGWLIAGLIGALLFGFPSPANWPYLVLTCVVHTAYALFLIKAYQHADFSLAYPIARGSAPLFVTVSAPILLDEYLEGPSQFAVTLLLIGIFLTGIFRGGGGLGGGKAVMLSLATGVLIATYTMIDAEGARAGASSLAYASWLFILTSVALIGLASRRPSGNFYAAVRSRARSGVPMGFLSAVAYWAILWAMTVAPTALVAATRETSILFAALIGWGFLGEKIPILRWLGIICILSGLLLAKL